MTTLYYTILVILEMFTKPGIAVQTVNRMRPTVPIKNIDIPSFMVSGLNEEFIFRVVEIDD